MVTLKKFLILLSLVFYTFPCYSFEKSQFYIAMFASEGYLNLAIESHTFAVFAEIKNEELKEKFTISWMPEEKYLGPNNTMPQQFIVPGKNYTLEETLKLGKNRVTTYWGPYEIQEDLFHSAKRRLKYLETKHVKYKMILNGLDYLRKPASNNEPGGAINCTIAVSDIGGYLPTMADWGNGASWKVLNFFGLPEEQLPDYLIAKLMDLPQ